MNTKLSVTSTKIIFLTFLCIGIYVLYQLYGFSLGHNVITKYKYHKESLFNWYKKTHLAAPEKEILHHHNHKSDEDTSLADKLYNEVKVLCWIQTRPENHKDKARHIKRTWGKRCNKILFISTETDKELDSIALSVKDYIWGKTKEAFKYIYEHHINEYDWFLKADDETYVIVENLRYMLYSYDPKSPLYFGCKFKPHVKQGYMSGRAGYVLSKQSVKMFVENGLPNPQKCRIGIGGVEDIEMGKCLENIGVKAADSRDSSFRDRFFPMNPIDHLVPIKGSEAWYWTNTYYKAKKGLDCCSDYAISFHNIFANQMYVLDYLIYHLRPFGIHMNKALLEN